MRKEDGTDHRDVGEDGDADPGKPGNGEADEVPPEEGACSRTEHGQSEAADHLVALQGNADESMDKAHESPHEKGRRHAEPCAACGIGGGKAGVGPHEHDAFKAEVEDSSLFRENLPQGGVENGGSAPDRGGEDGDDHFHVMLPPCGECLSPE
ncbi:hypothetical protein SDC9_179475 [bioreactor metagenome]|uniref:Uncharacterized protein n=1 Tax=bioreactor metagenome TaxID=1076179 RepID=A0A645H002_9ZZZZ